MQRLTFLLMCLRAVRDRYAPDCAAAMRCSSSCPSLRPTYSFVPSADSASADMVEPRACGGGRVRDSASDAD